MGEKLKMWVDLLCCAALNGDIPDTQAVQDATVTAHYHLLLTLTIVLFIKIVKHEDRKVQVINTKDKTSNTAENKQCARRNLANKEIWYSSWRPKLFCFCPQNLPVRHIQNYKVTQSPTIMNNHDKHKYKVQVEAQWRIFSHLSLWQM